MRSGELGWWEVFGLRFIRPNILLNVAPTREGAPYPMVLFSPGNGTDIEFCSGLAREMVGHGYIVVGLNHPMMLPQLNYPMAALRPMTRINGCFRNVNMQLTLQKELRSKPLRCYLPWI